MKKILKKAFKVVLPLFLGGFILVWVYRDFDFSRVGEVLLEGMDYSWMLLSLFFGMFSHVFRGWRWQQTLAPLGEYPSATTCVNAVFVSYAANLVLPRVGEVSRCGALSKYEGVSFSKSLGTVVTERLIDACCILLLTGVTLLMQLDLFQRFFVDTGTGLGALTRPLASPFFYAGLAGLVLLLVLLYYLLRSLSFFSRLKRVALNIWEGVFSLRNVEKKWLFALYTLLIWICYFLHFYLTFYSFEFTHDLGVEAGLVLFVVGTIAVIVPTPNGAGPWHFAVITMMGFYGISKENAGIFALLVHGIQTFLIILLGIYGAMALSLSTKKKTYENN